MSSTVFKIGTLSIFLMIVSGCKKKQDFFSWQGLSNKNLHDVTIQRTDDSKGLESMSGIAKNIQFKVTARNDDEAGTEKLWQGTEFSIKGFYEMREAPYPGFITRAVGCAENLKPILLNGATRNFKKGLMLFSNERLMFGICDPKMLTNRALILVEHCPNARKSFVVKLFAGDTNQDFSDLKKIFDGFLCD